MEPTAIQAEKPKAPPSAIQEGLPPGVSTGVPRTEPKAESKHPIVQALEMAADLRITVFLFVLALLLVFWGTLAQVDFGVWTVVKNYFRSFFVWVPLKVVFFNAADPGIDMPFPGGWLIGSAMLINLLAAHAVRFKLAWNRTGIIMVHAGLIIMMLGEFITGMYAIEGSMAVKIGQSTNTVIEPRFSEIAISRTIDDKKDEVITIPYTMLTRDAVIERSDLPFKIQVIDFMVNSQLFNKPDNTRADKGFGKVHLAKEVPEVNGVDPEQPYDQPSVYVRLTAKDQANVNGVWLFSTRLPYQTLKVGDKEYRVELRYKHTTRPFTMHLKDFKHDVFPGTEKPKDFHSYIRLVDPDEKVDRDNVEIFMNSPLYYRGETFYQSSWTTDENGKADGTILQVVRNPCWVLPYLSCAVVGFGLLIHFAVTFFRNRRTAS